MSTRRHSTLPSISYSSEQRGVFFTSPYCQSHGLSSLQARSREAQRSLLLWWMGWCLLIGATLPVFGNFLPLIHLELHPGPLHALTTSNSSSPGPWDQGCVLYAPVQVLLITCSTNVISSSSLFRWLLWMWGSGPSFFSIPLRITRFNPVSFSPGNSWPLNVTMVWEIGSFWLWSWH